MSSSESHQSLLQYVSSVPLLTKTLIGVNCTIHLFNYILDRSSFNDALSAAAVMSPNYEWNKFISYAFVHMSFLHLLMNMLTMLQLGAALEQQFGTLQFLLLTVAALVMIPLFYVFLEWCAYEISSSTSHLYTSVVGYSGVLFAYAVVDAFHEPNSSRILCGVEISSYLYPFLLLFLLQILVPEVSFVGHASGVLVGLLVVYGYCTCFFPSQATITTNIENPDCFLYEWISHSSYVQVSPTHPDGFVVAPAAIDSSQVVQRQDWSSCCGYITICGGICQERLFALRQWVGEHIWLSSSNPSAHEYGAVPSTTFDTSGHLEEGSSVTTPAPLSSTGSNSHRACSADNVAFATSQTIELTHEDVKAIRVAKFQKS